MSSEAPTCPKCGALDPASERGEVAERGIKTPSPGNSTKRQAKPLNIDEYVMDAYSDAYAFACRMLQRGRVADYVAQDLRRRFELGQKEAALVVHTALDDLADSGNRVQVDEGSARVPDRPTWLEVEAERRARSSTSLADRNPVLAGSHWVPIWIVGLVLLFGMHALSVPAYPQRDATDFQIDIIGAALGDLFVFALFFVWWEKTRPWIIVGACALAFLQVFILPS